MIRSRLLFFRLNIAIPRPGHSDDLNRLIHHLESLLN